MRRAACSRYGETSSAPSCHLFAGEGKRRCDPEQAASDWRRPPRHLGASSADTGSDLPSGIRSAVALDHNFLARTDNTGAAGFATSAASASPMATASANPLDHQLTF